MEDRNLGPREVLWRENDLEVDTCVSQPIIYLTCRFIPFKSKVPDKERPAYLGKFQRDGWCFGAGLKSGGARMGRS